MNDVTRETRASARVVTTENIFIGTAQSHQQSEIAVMRDIVIAILEAKPKS